MIFVVYDHTKHSYVPVYWVLMSSKSALAYDQTFQAIKHDLNGAFKPWVIGIDFEIGDFIVDTGPNTDPVTFDVYVLRIDDEGEYVFGSDDLTLEPDTRLFLNYQEWIADGTVMYGDFDYNNDGEIDESVELPDEADTWFED